MTIVLALLLIGSSIVCLTVVKDEVNCNYNYKIIQEAFPSKPLGEGFEPLCIGIQYNDNHSEIRTFYLKSDDIIKYLSMREDIERIDLLLSYEGGDIDEWHNSYIVRVHTWMIE